MSVSVCLGECASGQVTGRDEATTNSEGSNYLKNEGLKKKKRQIGEWENWQRAEGLRASCGRQLLGPLPRGWGEERRAGTPFQPPPPPLWVRATTSPPVPAAKVDCSPSACLLHLAEHHPATQRLNPTPLQPPTRSALKDALYVRCLFPHKLCGLCLLLHDSPFFSLLPPPASVFFFHQLLMNFWALLWMGVNCSPGNWLQRKNSPARERHTARLQKCRLALV